ncbi:hypothetical protein F7725_025838 [Dissostichus mawsoni]|uniref:P2X purinoreceptor 7 intracellular domain-containing protein n=1 Tax=Dissostichus mawsoni TaxID=36200 RepID=A0A7J5X5S6_DISMA|nr:hypothetical protein F7725_025838 [Dissostichus mawsoni]
METIEECQCCQEKDVMVAKMEEFNEYEGDGANITCVIDHPGFQSNCLDAWVLQTAYHHYSKRDRQQAGDQPRNEMYRYLAYRQLVRFCWGILGKNHRIPLPSCAIKKIQATFPSDIYTSFKCPALD